MSHMEKELQIGQLSKMEAISSEFSRFGDDYVFSRIKPESERKLGTPMAIRIAGLSFLLCRSGNLTVDINLSPHHLSEGVLLCVPPQSVINTYDADWTNLDADMLILSTEFMRSIATVSYTHLTQRQMCIRDSCSRPMSGISSNGTLTFSTSIPHVIPMTIISAV